MARQRRVATGRVSAGTLRHAARPGDHGQHRRRMAPPVRPEPASAMYARRDGSHDDTASGERDRARRRRGRRPGGAGDRARATASPRCAHSWRHQIEPLAAAGYHVLAPDQRGYGRSSAPTDVDGVRHRPPRRRPARAARRHRPRRRRLRRPRLGRPARVGPRPACTPSGCAPSINVSVPVHRVAGAADRACSRRRPGDRFFYILYFQPVGPAEARAGRRRRADDAHGAVGGVRRRRSQETAADAAAGRGHRLPRRRWRAVGPIPAELPAWLTEADLAAYVDSFEASGFFGPVSWYRNLDAQPRPGQGPPGAGDAGVVHRRHPRRASSPTAPATSRRWTARLPDLRGTVLHRRRRPLDPAGGAGGVQPGAAGGAGGAGRRRRRGVSLSGRTHGRRQPRPATLRAGGQWPSRL